MAWAQKLVTVWIEHVSRTLNGNSADSAMNLKNGQLLKSWVRYLLLYIDWKLGNETGGEARQRLNIAVMNAYFSSDDEPGDSY